MYIRHLAAQNFHQKVAKNNTLHMFAIHLYWKAKSMPIRAGLGKILLKSAGSNSILISISFRILPKSIKKFKISFDLVLFLNIMGADNGMWSNMAFLSGNSAL